MIADRKGSTIGIRAYNSIGRQMKLCLYGWTERRATGTFDAGGGL
ncbi:hypothetical protein FHW03_004706 [Ochrobactrum sp. RH2CCR150]|nr:hypothetical protein [Ochrobactrum sp. RH2CCR150]